MSRGTAVVVALALGLSAQLGCGDDDGSESSTMPSGQAGMGTAATPGGATAGAGSGANTGSSAGGSAAAGTSSPDGASGASGAAGGAGSSAGTTAGSDAEPEAPCDPTAGGKVSSPGKYQGYGEALYDGNERSSLYVPVRDGTRLAVDVFRPTKDGQVASDPLPVLFMHTPYN
ncbi:MAG TPA: hypothetical protein VK509_16350, partial [Polyangiales bacterium]|nr:hypothetical protein [Polyangiales bacterium]